MNKDNKFDDALDEILEEKYISEISQIKAPRELVDRTKLEMRAELGKKVQPSLFDKRIKVKFSYRRLFLVVAFLLLIGSSFVYYYQKDQIHIVAVSQNQFSVDKSFGKFDTSHQTKEKQPIELIMSYESTIIPEVMVKVASSRVDGQKLRLAQDGKTYYASFSKGEHYYFVIGKGVSKKDFINYLKKTLRNM